MFLNAIGTALPDIAIPRRSAGKHSRSRSVQAAQSRSHLIARTVLQRDNGIEARFLSVASLEDVFAIDPDTLQQRFAAHRRGSPTAAAQRAMQRADLSRARSMR